MSARTFAFSLSDESSEQLKELASHRGVSSGALIEAVVEHMLASEREALAAHEEGIRQFERGEFHTNEEVRALLDSMIQEKTAA